MSGRLISVEMPDKKNPESVGVQIRVNVLGTVWCYWFGYTAHSEAEAVLLTEKLMHDIDKTLTDYGQEQYEAGWRDAKSHKTGKREKTYLLPTVWGG